MRVAYLMRVDAFDKPGGDVEHMRTFLQGCTHAAQRRGMEFHAEILTDLSPELREFDVVHLSNLDRPVDLYAQYRAAKRAGLPVILTPLHHSYREIERYERLGRGGLVGTVSGLCGFYVLEALRMTIKSRRYRQARSALRAALVKGFRDAQAEVIRGSSFVTPLTHKEAEDISREIAAIPLERTVLLNLGIHPDRVPATQRSANEREIEVAVIARVESRKNQLAILQALRQIGSPGTFIGPPNPNHASYVAALRAQVEEDDHFTYVAGVPAEEVSGILANSRVHVSASWFEVSSLVDLDAYLQGCRVVASRCGGTRELLGDDAYYVDPALPEDICDKVAAAIASAAAGQQNDVGGLLRRLKTWNSIGEQLLDLYLAAAGQASTEHLHNTLNA